MYKKTIKKKRITLFNFFIIIINKLQFKNWLFLITIFSVERNDNDNSIKNNENKNYNNNEKKMENILQGKSKKNKIILY